MSGFQADHFVNRERTFKLFVKLLDLRSKFSVMRVEAPARMGKTWLLLKMERQCKMASFPVSRINFGTPLDSVRNPLELIRLLADRFDDEANFEPLTTAYSRLAVQSGTPGLSVLPRLADEVIASYPTHNQLERLAALHDVVYDNLGGETLSEKAFHLLQNRLQRGVDLLRELLEAIIEERPNVSTDWMGFLAEIEAPVVSSAEISIPINSRERAILIRQITNIFFDCLRSIITTHPSGQAILLIDSWERAPFELQQWFTELLLPQLQDPELQHLVVVVAGSEGVSSFTHPSITSLIAPAPPDWKRFVYELPNLELEHFVTYMEDVRKLEEPGDGITWNALHFASDGIPGELPRLAAKLEREFSARDSHDDPFFN